MNARTNDMQVSRLLADGYSQRILSYTYKKPMSAQKLSKACRIPIAACYRRIHELEKVGLLSIADEKEIYKGRKVKLYRCRLKSASLRFSGGKFKVIYNTLPEERIEVEELSSDISEEKTGQIVISDDGSDGRDDIFIVKDN